MTEAIQTFCRALLAGGLFSAGFLAVSAVQWYWVIRGWMGMKSPSLIPLVGGVLGFLALYTADVPGAMRFCWVPFLLDPGSGLMLCNGVYHLLLKRRR